MPCHIAPLQVWAAVLRLVPVLMQWCRMVVAVALALALGTAASHLPPCMQSLKRWH